MRKEVRLAISPGRYVLKIHSNVESGQKIIQFNIHSKFKSENIHSTTKMPYRPGLPPGPYRTKNAGTNRALTCDKHMFLSKAFKKEHLLSGIVIIDLRDCHIHCKTKHNVLSRCSNFTCGKPSTEKRFDEIDSFKVTPPLLTTCNETLI